MAKHSLYFLFALAVSLASVWFIGVNLGGAFAISAIVALLSPIAASSDVEIPNASIATIATALGVAAAAVALNVRDTFTLGQIISIMGVVCSLGISLAAATRLLMFVRISPAIAAGATVLLAIAWLSWPIWLSPWLSSTESDAIAMRLTAVHPLLAINTIAPSFGYWPQSRYMYQWTALGQDMLFSLPNGVAGCVMFHSAVAVIAVLPIAARRCLSHNLLDTAHA